MRNTLRRIWAWIARNWKLIVSLLGLIVAAAWSRRSPGPSLPELRRRETQWGSEVEEIEQEQAEHSKTIWEEQEEWQEAREEARRDVAERNEQREKDRVIGWRRPPGDA